jgi:hypothetical protein
MSTKNTTTTKNNPFHSITQPKGSWVDKESMSNSTTRAKIAFFPRQTIGTVLKIPDHIVNESS